MDELRLSPSLVHRLAEDPLALFRVMVGTMSKIQLASLVVILLNQLDEKAES